MASGVLSVEQVEEGLRAQVMWGGRLGTNLVELGLVDLDGISRALGRQHTLPAALAGHFQKADRSLQMLLSADLADKFACVPLLRAGKRIVISSCDPLDDDQLAHVADELAVDPSRIVPSIAAELRMRYQLERVYQIPRDQRFLRSKNATSHSQLFQLRPSLDPALDLAAPAARASVVALLPTAPAPEDAALLLDEPAHDAAPLVHEASDERRTYVRTLADMLNRHPDKDSVVARVHRIAVGTQAIQPLAVRAATLSAIPLDDAALGTSLGEAIRAIHRAPDRDQLARLVIGATARYLPAIRAALLLVIRGEAAVSWTGFCRDGTALPPLAVPLDYPGLIPAAITRRVPVRGSSGDVGPIDFLLLASLGVPYGDLIACPIAIADHVMSLIVIGAEHGAAIASHDLLGDAAGVAFSRLMRDAGT